MSKHYILYTISFFKSTLDDYVDNYNGKTKIKHRLRKIVHHLKKLLEELDD